MTVASGRVRAGAFGVVETPPYAIYERGFGFSKAVLTLVFATYALCRLSRNSAGSRNLRVSGRCGSL
jgi:hypothetical protein